jgi:hypothetical protein
VYQETWIRPIILQSNGFISSVSFLSSDEAFLVQIKAAREANMICLRSGLLIIPGAFINMQSNLSKALSVISATFICLSREK